MSKFTGLGMALSIDDDAGNPVTTFGDYVDDVTVTNSFGDQDVTPLSAFAMDRLQLTEDAKISIKGGGWPDDTIMTAITTNMRLPVDGRDVVITYPSGWTYTVKAMIFSFSPARPQNGGITWGLELNLTGGVAGVWAN